MASLPGEVGVWDKNESFTARSRVKHSERPPRPRHPPGPPRASAAITHSVPDRRASAHSAASKAACANTVSVAFDVIGGDNIISFNWITNHASPFEATAATNFIASFEG